MIANTILQQLGGHGFTVMTGGRNYINLGNGLQMSLTRNKTSANRLKIILRIRIHTPCISIVRH